jgi:hypothetical protein
MWLCSSWRDLEKPDHDVKKERSIGLHRTAASHI